MQLRRSQLEQEKRHSEREELAKKVATVHSHDPFSARILTAKEFSASISAAKEGIETQKKEATFQEKQLSRDALRTASNTFRDIGLHSVKLFPNGEVTISDSLKGPKLNLIRSASVKLPASILVADGKRVASKPFFVNLSYEGGKFSVDSLEKNNQLLPVNKGSLVRLAAMDEEGPKETKKEEDKEEEEK